MNTTLIQKFISEIQSHSIIEAVNRQFAHYSYHIGQIVYIGRMIKGNEWKTLSIPKGKSSDFNVEKFSDRFPGGFLFTAFPFRCKIRYFGSSS
jgi:hypothetical protein